MKMSIIFLGVFGLFAQEFNASYSIDITVGSIAAILLGVIPDRFSATYLKLVLFVAIFLSGLHHAYDYYSSEQVQGNYYGGWIWSIPSSLIALAMCMKKRRISEV